MGIIIGCIVSNKAAKLSCGNGVLVYDFTKVLRLSFSGVVPIEVLKRNQNIALLLLMIYKVFAWQISTYLQSVLKLL